MASKRYFEALEDRRLLAGLVGASAEPSPASLMADAATAPTSPTPQSAAAANDPASAATTAESGAPSSAEAPNEYASLSGTTAAPSDAPSSYADAQYPSARASNYPANYLSYSTPYYSPVQTAAILSLAAAVGDPNQPAETGNASQAPAIVSTPAPGASAAAPTAPAGAVRWNIGDLVMRSESPQPFAHASAPNEAFAESAEALGDAIALLSPSDAALAGGEGDHSAELPIDRSADEAESSLLQPAGLLRGAVAANFGLIERGVDELFERLDQLGAELNNRFGPRQIGQALMAAAGAAAAWEYARARRREYQDTRTARDRRAPHELQLPHRLRRRREIP